MMKKSLWVMLAVSAGMAASLPEAKSAGLAIRDGDRVVFLGDSITEQRLYTTYLEAYWLTRYPAYKLSFRNVGWGGDTSWLRRRFTTDETALFAATPEVQQAMVEKAVGAGLGRDVLPLRPTVVTIDFGMNDHCYQPFRPDICAAYVCSQTQLAKVLKASGARVALITPQPLEERRPDPDQNSGNQSLRQFSDALKGVAATQGVAYVDQFAPYMATMLKARVGHPDVTIGGGDTIHPGPAGQLIMAWSILKGLGMPSVVSRVELDLTRWLPSRRVVVAENARVSNLAWTNGVLSFDRLDNALPMPIDERAESALAFEPI
ncbi:MAG: SGNH/GDSL hydrolase family protein [bacterium]